jgi:hypothetical protein
MDLEQFGGRKILLAGAFGDPNDPNNVAYNFGVLPEPEPVTNLIRAKPPLYAQFPNMQGRWDGKSTVNHWDAVLKNYGGNWGKAEELIHYQPRGTCFPAGTLVLWETGPNDPSRRFRKERRLFPTRGPSAGWSAP